MGGVSTETVPIFDAAGQATGAREPLPNWASVHASRPFAADGLSPMPAGRVTSARRVCEVSCVEPPTMCGSSTVVTAPEGESVCAVSGSTASDGSKGMVSHSFGEVPGGIFDSTKADPLGKFGFSSS